MLFVGNLVSENTFQRLVVFDPFVDIIESVVVFRVTDIDVLDPCVDDQALAHGAWHRVFDVLSRSHFLRCV